MELTVISGDGKVEARKMPAHACEYRVCTLRDEDRQTLQTTLNGYLSNGYLFIQVLSVGGKEYALFRKI